MKGHNYGGQPCKGCGGTRIHIHPFSGRHHIDTSKSKMSESHKGPNFKLSETRKRLFREGKLAPWNLGKPLSLERRAKLSESAKMRIGPSNSFFGQKHDELTKSIISYRNSHREGRARGGKPKGIYHQTPWNSGLEIAPRVVRICASCKSEYRARPQRNLKFCSWNCCRNAPKGIRQRPRVTVVATSAPSDKASPVKVAIPWNRGKHWSPEVRAKISAKAKGRQWRPESRQKVGETIRRLYAEGKMTHADFNAERNPNWQGGIMYAPYHMNFNYTARRLVRERDNYTCALCEGFGNLVHHINGDKSNPNPRLITLCFRCHGKVERNVGKYRPLLNQIFERRVAIFA